MPRRSPAADPEVEQALLERLAALRGADERCRLHAVPGRRFGGGARVVEPVLQGSPFLSAVVAVERI